MQGALLVFVMTESVKAGQVKRCEETHGQHQHKADTLLNGDPKDTIVLVLYQRFIFVFLRYKKYHYSGIF